MDSIKTQVQLICWYIFLFIVYVLFIFTKKKKKFKYVSGTIFLSLQNAVLKVVLTNMFGMSFQVQSPNIKT